MAHKTQPPTVTTTTGAGGDKESKIEHPCFGMIGASRRQGHSILFGSDFVHNNSVAISIKRCVLGRHLAHDWPYGREELIEVELSEAQWATLLSSMNVGDGVQCTIRHINNVGIPGIPEPERREKQFMGEAKAAVERAVTEIDELRGMVDELKVSQKQKDVLLSKMRQARQQIVDNAPFVIASFAEHMEKSVEKAKVEINAYATRHLIQTGIAALAHDRPETIIMLSEPKTESGE